jgi:hypothetical protein
MEQFHKQEEYLKELKRQEKETLIRGGEIVHSSQVEKSGEQVKGLDTTFERKISRVVLVNKPKKGKIGEDVENLLHKGYERKEVARILGITEAQVIGAHANHVRNNPVVKNEVVIPDKEEEQVVINKPKVRKSRKNMNERVNDIVDNYTLDEIRTICVRKVNKILQLDDEHEHLTWKPESEKEGMEHIEGDHNKMLAATHQYVWGMTKGFLNGDFKGEKIQRALLIKLLMGLTNLDKEFINS